eukprot:11508846-Alexandrium_andersonii.AAC.3
MAGQKHAQDQTSATSRRAALRACLHRLACPPPKEPSGGVGQQRRRGADLGQRRPHARGRPVPPLLVRRRAARVLEVVGVSPLQQARRPRRLARAFSASGGAAPGGRCTPPLLP